MFGFRLKSKIQGNVNFQLIVIFVIIAANYFIVSSLDTSLSDVEKTINLAGSNRTYSQQITLFAKLIQEGKHQYNKDLAETISLLNTNIDNFGANSSTLTETSGKAVKLEPVPEALRTSYYNPLKLAWEKFKVKADKVAESKGSLNPEVEEAIQYLEDHSMDLMRKNDDFVAAYLTYFDNQQARKDSIFFGIFIFNISVLVFMYVYIRNNVTKPISKLNEIDSIIKEGNYDRHIDYNRDDELGRVGKSINALFQNLKSATDFIIDIGEGKLESKYSRLSEIDAKNDRLGSALMEMRDKMRQVAESDSQRNWTSEGLAKFAEIFRTYSHSEDFTYIIISNLVRYLGANQGGVFIVEDENKEDSHLELIAAYAYEKRKYINKRIDKGEGLVGEVYQDGNTIYMTEVPSNYVHITSGLGDASPRSILLIPLKLNEVIYGVIELASFQEFALYQIEFVERLGESIASTFASVKSNRQTEKLLKESIQLSEQMKAQEEEMRQNLEELVTTQEELQRKNQLIEDQKIELEKTLKDEQQKITLYEAQLTGAKNKIEHLEKQAEEFENEANLLRHQKHELEKALREELEKNLN